MTKIAILGASSHIAKSLIDYFWMHDRKQAIGLHLFARTPEKVNVWLAAHSISIPIQCKSIRHFEHDTYDLIINMVGTSNSLDQQRLGSEIFNTALEHDEIVLSYLRLHPNSRYFFLSSGAVYGNDFTEPAQQRTMAKYEVNCSASIDWYSLSKFCIEARHRALNDLAIVDIRVFSFFSSWINLAQPFLLSDALRAIGSNGVLRTDTSDFWRDYVGVADLAQLVNCFIDSAPCNVAVDLYSKNPIRKSQVLELFSTDFDLRYTFDVIGSSTPSNRKMYFSKNHMAARWGYSPSLDSEQLLKFEVPKVLKAFQI